MHKRFFGPLLGVLAAALLFSANAVAFDEGIDYTTLSQPQPTETGDKIEVVELFWYGCPHCYHLEPQLKSWLAAKPDYVEFRRMPAVMGRGWAIHGRAYFAAEMMGVLDQVHEPLFSALHDQKLRLFDEKSIADWMAKQGVDREEFLKAYKSFVVDMKVRRAMQYGQRLGLDGVPAFVVNGKYTTSPTQTASIARTFQVIAHLVAMEAGEEKPALAEQQPTAVAVEPAVSTASEASGDSPEVVGDTSATAEPEASPVTQSSSDVPEDTPTASEAVAQSQAEPAAAEAPAAQAE